MELKNYQKKVIADLQNYLHSLKQSANLAEAWKNYWQTKDIAVGNGGVPAYKDNIQGVPAVCMKVPTGGGKTFLACSAIKHIFDFMPAEKPKLVVWLVPSDPILEQTLKNLSNPDHPYKQALDRDFGGRVQVLNKAMLLNGQGFSADSVQHILTICVLSFDSLRINSGRRYDRKIYQENSNLADFAAFYKNDEVLLEGTPETALIQVLRHLRPVTIVDESHNATSALSVEMLNNIYPSFILELTATPKSNSNVVSYVDARELKKENMVKLPVIVYKRNSRESVIADAIQLRGKLEQKALEEEAVTGNYIRPIVLFQAQPRSNDDNTTFDKIKNLLLEIGIPEEEIAIKTGEINDLKNVDLLSKACAVRYIITVNALKEGWDCPFAYILASLANKTSAVDVEQILGRVLRQPYTRQHQHFLLNSSYVLSCSNDFRNTLDSIVKGLNGAGFSRKDYRVGGDEEVPAQEQQPHLQPQQEELFNNNENAAENNNDDDFTDITPENLLEGFRLTGQDANVNFKLASGEMYSVDIAQSGEAVPQYRMVTDSDKKKLREYLDSLPQERQIATCIDAICAVINRKNAYSSTDIRDYVKRVIDGLHSDDLLAMLTAKETYAKKIQEKIDKLAAVYKQKRFMQLLDEGEIECCERYEVPDFITPLDFTDALPKSLYEAEKNDMNEYEHKVLDVIIGQSNIVWWHRIIERQGFCINGFINHYPDFLVLTKNGKVLLIEAKGDHLANDDSENKLLLGRKWQEAAGRDYRYMMVFEKKEFQHDGAYTLDEFAEVIKKL